MSNELTVKLKEVHNGLLKLIPQMRMALPKHLTAERLQRLAFTEFRKNPQLVKCTIQSFLGCIMECAQLGLEPGGVLGQAYLLPFKNTKTDQLECQLVIGYKGMIKLARNSGDLKSITAQPVYTNDVFEYEYGTNERLKHVPAIGERGEFVGAYAFVRLKDEGYQFNFITKTEINKVKDGSLKKITNDYAKKYSPWMTSFGEMAAKTAIRRLFKYLPISIEEKMERALALENALETDSQSDLILGLDNDELTTIERNPETGEINQNVINDVVAQMETVNA